MHFCSINHIFHFHRQLDWILHSDNDTLIELDIKQLENKRLSSDHFTADDFIVGYGMERLKDIAIPIQKASVTDSDDSDNVNEHDCSEIDLPPITCQERSAIDLEIPFVTESSFNMPQSFVAEEPSCSGMQSLYRKIHKC